MIFQHSDDTLGPAGTDEWMAFVNDSEGNTVGLVSYADSRPQRLVVLRILRSPRGANAPR